MLRGALTMGKKLTLFNKVSYGFSDLGNNLVFVAVTNYLMFYYTDVVGMGLGAIGLLFLIIRIVDAVSGPVFGVLVDKTNTRFGKVRPWFLWMSIPYAISTILLFSIGSFHQNLQIPLAYITYGIFSLCYVGLGTAINAILPSLSADLGDRAQANMFRNILGQTGGLLSGLIILPLVTLLGGGINQPGFLKAMSIFAILLAICELVTFFGVREHVQAQTETPPTLKQSLSALLPNLPWWTIALTNLVIFLGVVVKISSMVYFFKYILNNANYSSVANSVNAVSMIIGALCIPLLIRRFKMRTIVIAGLGIAIAGQAILYIAATAVSIPIAMVGIFVSSFGLGSAQSLMFVMTAETVDYGEWRFGVRAQGFLISMSTVGVNIGAGLAGALTSFVLAAYSFVPNVQQSAQGIAGINMLFVVIPAIIFAICIGLISFYRLDADSKQMHQELGEKRLLLNKNSA